MKYQQFTEELDDMVVVLSNTPQKTGFNHPFYVPGWVGFIQECFVEHKMNKTAKIPIYKGLSYFECADKIIDLVKDACGARKYSDDFQKGNDCKDNLDIVSSAMKAVDAWINVYPEIALWMNRQLGENTIVSTAYIVRCCVESALSDIVDIPKEESTSKSKSSFGSDTKAFVSQIAAIICNCIVFVVVWVLLIAIFG